MTTIIPSDYESAFFDGAREGVFKIQHCRHCGHYQFALTGRTAGVRRCRQCTTPAPEWVPAQGTGSLISYTATHLRSATPGAPPEVHLAGIVELTEGPWVCAAIDGDPGSLQAGMPMTAGFVPGDEDGTPPRPVFRP